ncbi:ApaG protein [Limimonas halophila]|uniref:Protein ApaG n=1 Tax=Limimonas halophila TaxID=1082479 RepID=A0A1G7U2S9_9PROT|nr:Co2+/Mg2+ efflux protein ApaG [Limimonas halophila]SDG41359.1 ApaG protein [Limimonas halophila]
MYSHTTQDIRITVQPYYLDDQSSPSEEHYVWAYHVKIENVGERTVQLLKRHWQITDARGCIQEVRGSGVVGEQPVLEPGESFEYTSGTPLAAPSGVMVGTYEMEADSGERFDVDIPPFSLDSPHQPVQLN